MRVRLKQLRASKGWTQRATAEALGLSIDSIKSMEIGRSLPSLKTALHIKNAFGCASIDEIIEAS